MLLSGSSYPPHAPPRRTPPAPPRKIPPAPLGTIPPALRRRIPYIWVGSLLQFGGLSIMPFALILLSGDTHWPYWFAFFASGISFLLVGSGIQIVQTTGLALATDISPESVRPRVVALMYTMLLVGMVISSLFLSFLLEPFSQIRLIQVIQGVAVFCFFLNLVALWKQEARNPLSTKAQKNIPSFFQIWRKFSSSKTSLMNVFGEWDDEGTRVGGCDIEPVEGSKKSS